MKLSRPVLKSALILSMLALLVACETPDDNKVEQARACVDGAAKTAFSDPTTASTLATNCQQMIVSSGIQTKEAAQVLFGAILIKQKKLSSLATMATNMKTKLTGMDSLNGALNVMTFDLAGGVPSNSDLQDATDVQTAGNVLGGGAQTVAEAIYIATAAASFSSTAITNAGSTLSSIQNVPPAQQAAIGTAVLQMQASACASNLDQTSTDPNNLCYKSKQILSGATNPTDPTAVYNALAAYMAASH